ncbi:MAG: hypothetical protein HKN30_12430 [Sulfitobacter sp.]|nr:hypothetical protein [Sulfitobacter sp.]
MALRFKTTEVNSATRDAATIWNRTNGPIEVYARFVGSAAKADITSEARQPTQTKPLIIQSKVFSGVRLVFKPKVEGTHGRTIEIGWRPVGSTFGWDVKHHFVTGLVTKKKTNSESD